MNQNKMFQDLEKGVLETLAKKLSHDFWPNSNNPFQKRNNESDSVAVRVQVLRVIDTYN